MKVKEKVIGKENRWRDRERHTHTVLIQAEIDKK